MRLQELTEEAKRRLIYVRNSFAVARISFGQPSDFNHALAKLKDEVERGENSGVIPRHGELGFAVWYRSKLAAEERGAQPGSAEDIARGRQEAASLFTPRGHRLFDEYLYRHVKAAMAVIQEATGLPVIATRMKNNQYDPQGSGRLAELVIGLLRSVDPTISVTQIVNYIIRARLEFRGKRMRLEMFCPGYGMTVTPF